MSKLFVDEIVHQSSQGSGTITLGASGETVSFASGVTGLNYPAFEANLSSDQSLTDNTETKVQFNTEIFDTDNCYDNSTNYRFTPTVAGKYFVYSALNAETFGSANLQRMRINLFVNGSVYRQSQFLAELERPRQLTPCMNAIVDMNGTTDYVEIFVLIDDTSGNPELKGGSNKQSYFGAYRIGT